MKWPRVMPAWMYRDPGEIADELAARTARIEAPRPAMVQACAPGERDRYYTMARRAAVRFHVKQAMRGGR